MTTEKARISEVLFWEAGIWREQKQKRKKTIMLENLESSDQDSFTNRKKWFHPQVLFDPYPRSQSAERQQTAVRTGQSEREMSNDECCCLATQGCLPQIAKAGVPRLGLCSCWWGLALSWTSGVVSGGSLMQWPLLASVTDPLSPATPHSPLVPYATTAFIYCFVNNWHFSSCWKKMSYSTIRLLEKKPHLQIISLWLNTVRGLDVSIAINTWTQYVYGIYIKSVGFYHIMVFNHIFTMTVKIPSPSIYLLNNQQRSSVCWKIFGFAHTSHKGRKHDVTCYTLLIISIYQMNIHFLYLLKLLQPAQNEIIKYTNIH